MCESVFEWMMAAGAVEQRQENGPLFVCLATQEGQQYNGRHLQGLHYCGPRSAPTPLFSKQISHRLHTPPIALTAH